MITWLIVAFILGMITGVCAGFAAAHAYLAAKFGG